MDLHRIQKYLIEHEMDGWLLADFHGRNEIAVTMLGLGSHLTRRACYFIPAEGEPVALVNPVEANRFSHLAGHAITYRGYLGLEDELRRLLGGLSRVAMEYSTMGRLPYIGLVDAGTIELVRSLGVEVVSSGDLVANFQARLSSRQIESHRRAAGQVNQIKDAAFGFIADSLEKGELLTEADVCRFILREFEANGMVTDFEPNCSVGANAGNPHYDPMAVDPSPIRPGSLILIDLWARFDDENGVYADITWMAYAGAKEDVPAAYAEKFAILVEARDRAVTFLNENPGSRPVRGYEVDDLCRGVVEQAGYGAHFTHRTGHSITSNVHGEGPNIDNLETEDRRILQPGHLFSLEPGIYMEDCGLRTEINCLITENGAEVTTKPVQREILPLG